jgi:hypothetical protein
LADANLGKYPARHQHLDLATVRQLIATWAQRLQNSEHAAALLTDATAPTLQPTCG